MKTTPKERLVFWAICEVVRSFWSLLMFTRQDMRCGCGITDFSEKCCDEELTSQNDCSDLWRLLLLSLKTICVPPFNSKQCSGEIAGFYSRYFFYENYVKSILDNESYFTYKVRFRKWIRIFVFLKMGCSHCGKEFTLTERTFREINSLVLNFFIGI